MSTGITREPGYMLREIAACKDTRRTTDLRKRVREAMERPPVEWECPARIDEAFFEEPLAVRKARAIELKLSSMPCDLWEGQLFAGSMTLEESRLHAEYGFSEYTTESERAEAADKGLTSHSVFGHTVPDYPRLLSKGLSGIIADAQTERRQATSAEEEVFLESVVIACEGVMKYADRLVQRCEIEAEKRNGTIEYAHLRQMALNLRQVPGGPARSFWQALQSVWLLHMIFHSTMNSNAMGRLDQYVWPFLERDLEAGHIDIAGAAELVDCFTLKFNERAETTEMQLAESRRDEKPDYSRRTRHHTSSQLGSDRDSLDATNHWLQNIVAGGLKPDGTDGTNPLTLLLLRSYHRNRMTNPLLTIRLHRESPEELVGYVAEVLKDGGGMPAIFNDEAIVTALEGLGIPREHALDYTNDGCWEVIIPGRTDFRFQRLSLMLCLEWALNRGRSRLDGTLHGPDCRDAKLFSSYDEVWQAFLAQLDYMVGRVVRRVVDTVNDRSTIAPVPLLSALIDGAVESRRDMTAGGARFRTFGMLAEGAAHAIDSLTAIRKVIFDDGAATMGELVEALGADFHGHEKLRRRLEEAPKYGNDDEYADGVGREAIGAFIEAVRRHSKDCEDVIRFPSGVGTFSWYIGIGEGLGASPDGRLAGEPVSSNFSPALGRDMEGLPGAILSYSKMHQSNLPAGCPLDLRLSRRLVEGDEGTGRLAGLLRAFVDSGGAMMTLTVADTEMLKAARREPDRHKSLRVRMGGWCAYFTMLSREQQGHHIRRQGGRG